MDVLFYRLAILKASSIIHDLYLAVWEYLRINVYVAESLRRSLSQRWSPLCCKDDVIYVQYKKALYALDLATGRKQLLLDPGLSPSDQKLSGKLEVSAPAASGLCHSTDKISDTFCDTQPQRQRYIDLGHLQDPKVRSDRPLLSTLAPKLRHDRNVRKLVSTKSSAVWDRTHLALYDSAQLTLVNIHNGEQRTLCINENIRIVAGGRGVYSLVGVQDNDTLERSILLLDARTGHLLSRVNRDPGHFIEIIEGDSFIKISRNLKTSRYTATKYRVFF